MTEWMVLVGWGSVNLSHLFTFHRRNSAALNGKGEVDLLQLWSDFDPNPLDWDLHFLV